MVSIVCKPFCICIFVNRDILSLHTVHAHTHAHTYIHTYMYIHKDAHTHTHTYLGRSHYLHRMVSSFAERNNISRGPRRLCTLAVACKHHGPHPCTRVLDGCSGGGGGAIILYRRPQHHVPHLFDSCCSADESIFVILAHAFI